MNNPVYNTIILGAGASGLMCAMTAGQRNQSVLVIDHNKRIGQKVLISGGGKCNFTNLYVDSENYISLNPHFCKSALNRYSPYEIIDWLQQNNITIETREHGQQFCIESSGQVVNLFHNECRKAGVDFQLNTEIQKVEKTGDYFSVQTNQGEFSGKSLVIATGGISWPSAGSSDIGYKIAQQFGHSITKLKPGLVPLRINLKKNPGFQDLSGISLKVTISYNSISFTDDLLFTHKGISGPVALQISNYWQKGKKLSVNLLPEIDLEEMTNSWRFNRPKAALKTLLTEILPKRLVQYILAETGCDRAFRQYIETELHVIFDKFTNWQITLYGTEGYKKAEVTLGGIDTKDVSSKTFESKLVPRLFLVGELLDVTGWLGGYNLHWAWASGHCAGQFV